ncbi:MAG TPA: NUDIX hydrolase [Myxococcaceae bacterium]|nr:NUDIX hydrolase [Myxococcaceae bacterium]
MPREASAGGVVVCDRDGGLSLAVIRPRGRTVWALPKGHVDGVETLAEAAAREVLEETGLKVELDAPLGDIQYVYQFRGQKIFKQVHFFLFRCVGGGIDELDPGMRIEVEEARWIPWADAKKVLAYRGEREVVDRAAALLEGRSSASAESRSSSKL